MATVISEAGLTGQPSKQAVRRPLYAIAIMLVYVFGLHGLQLAAATTKPYRVFINPAKAMRKRVFISYAQENPDHNEEVLQLADRLRKQGVDARIDRYEPHPKQGWPTWMERQLLEADAILVVASKSYYERYNQNSGVGSGARFEAAIVKSLLLKNGVSFEKFAVVIFSAEDTRFIPELLQGCSRYTLNEGYENLYRWLTQQPDVLAAPLGEVVTLLPRHYPGTSHSFGSLCRALKPLLDDNYRVFRDFGPNSSKASPGDLRTDLTAWRHLKKSKIVPNNRLIRELVIRNKDIIPKEFVSVFDRLISHVDAFEVHVETGGIDYREHQFPNEITDIVQRAIDEDILRNISD